MIYITVDKNNTVQTYHYKPFDKEDGMNKTEEELLKTGFLVEEIPEFEQREGFGQILKYNGTEFSVEYIELPPTLPTQEEELAKLKAENAQLGQELVDFKLDYLSVPCQYHQEYSTWVDNKLEEEKANGAI